MSALLGELIELFADIIITFFEVIFERKEKKK